MNRCRFICFTFMPSLCIQTGETPETGRSGSGSVSTTTGKGAGRSRWWAAGRSGGSGRGHFSCISLIKSYLIPQMLRMCNSVFLRIQARAVLPRALGLTDPSAPPSFVRCQGFTYSASGVGRARRRRGPRKPLPRRRGSAAPRTDCVRVRSIGLWVAEM